ncbi:esterase E4-like isoform X2 [Zootermopsis nevadensis]|uniref:esterase E4-like isoform X2 n=1 Tax=Zootermopsis nevadensis TaxID=136037 RepID=UPI000B8E3BA7|nr:esterase E4-like isoform X2 [Zootermopsis nevadensis]XP_021912909.1 esterase E4-like isoform X2 [Zootermopsis nevadensis]XP_021912918.1 esterase E4-like isoform X2 [Zootermopsis nevadensis]
MAESVTVTVAQGGLRGKKVTTRTGITYYSFQGIPYCKPPVGPLRFKAPHPADSWEGIRDALTEGSVAPQIDDVVADAYLGEEDCLYLNVYTPKLPSNSGDDLKAVMVWIHGGGFYMGSGNTQIHGPDYLVAGDVVLVTFNYRLGALGFLSTEDSETSSNNGLKDQVMALRWVQQNIAQFGGDPGNVTIFGVSAGGGSVHFHLLSPMSAGLFHRAIAMSGVVLNPWALIEEPRDRAFRLGAALGSKATNSKELVEFLRTVPAQQLVEDIVKAQTPEEKASQLLFFAPTLETGAQQGEEVFLTGKPLDLMQEGRFHKVPFMSGITSQEGMLIMRAVFKNPTLLNELNNNYEYFVPSTMKLKQKSAKSQEIARKIKHFYFGDKPVSRETLQPLFDLFSDIYFITGIKKSIELQLQHSDTPIYFYEFSFDEKLGMIEKYLGDSTIAGVCHGAEVAYLFKAFYVNDDKLDPNTDYMKTVARMVKMWTNFAKTGNPTPKIDPLLGVTWTPVTKGELNYLNIDKELTMQKDIAKDRVAFWEELQSFL